MSERPRRASSSRRLTTRQAQIVDAALRIIAAKGSRRFTAQLLAEEVGLTGGALYRHFGSMHAVVDAIVDRVGESLFDGFPPDGADPIERLRLFFCRRVRTIRDHPDISRLLLSDHLAQAGSRAQSKRLDEFKRRSRAFVLRCLEEASADGLLADAVSPAAGSVVVLGSVLALSHANTRVASGPEVERLSDEVWWAIERMLRRTAAPAKRPARSARPARGRARA
jgi:AcrR family transcriptional regulator